MLNLSRKNSDTLETLLQTPEAQALADKREKKIASDRSRHVEQLGKVQAKAVSAWIANERATQIAMAEYEKRRTALREAESAVGVANAQRMNDSSEFGREIERHEAALRDTAHPAIAEFIAKLWALWTATMKAAPVATASLVKNPNTGKMQVQPGRQVIQPKVRMEAIREVIAMAEGLKLEADQSDIPAKLAELEATVPVVGADIPANSKLAALRNLVANMKNAA